jgi:hypothetical protein
MIYLVAEKHKKRKSMNSSWDRLGFGFGTRGQLEGTCIFYESTLHWLYDICLLCLYFPVTHEQTKIKTFYLCLGRVNLLFESNPVFECFLIVFFI